jgi:hypothetical protein
MVLNVANPSSEKRNGSVERNLILVHRRGSQAISDFERIGELIVERAPDIEVFIASTGGPCSATRKRAAHRPTLVVSPTPLFAFRPARGKVYQGMSLLKTEQMRRLEAAGLPVPDWELLDPDTTIDPARWGPFTILKPAFGTFGKGILLVRTCDVQDGAESHFALPAGHPGRQNQIIAQQFIDTGPYPAEYRVLTLFGRPLYCNRIVATEPRPWLDPNTPIKLSINALTNYPRHWVSEPNFDEDVLDLARNTAAALAEVPVHGIDVVREAQSGKIYVLEANPGGNTWHLSSDQGKAFQQHFNVDLYAQFDALSVAADVLIEKTRSEAE